MIKHFCDYCGAEMVVGEGVPLTINVHFHNRDSAVERHWPMLCSPCAGHITEQVEALIEDIGDSVLPPS